MYSGALYEMYIGGSRCTFMLMINVCFWWDKGWLRSLHMLLFRTDGLPVYQLFSFPFEHDPSMFNSNLFYA